VTCPVLNEKNRKAAEQKPPFVAHVGYANLGMPNRSSNNVRPTDRPSIVRAVGDLCLKGKDIVALNETCWAPGLVSGPLEWMNSDFTIYHSVGPIPYNATIAFHINTTDGRISSSVDITSVITTAITADLERDVRTEGVSGRTRSRDPAARMRCALVSVSPDRRFVFATYHCPRSTSEIQCSLLRRVCAALRGFSAANEHLPCVLCGDFNMKRRDVTAPGVSDGWQSWNRNVHDIDHVLSPLNPKPQPPNPKPYTLNPKPYTLNPNFST